MAEFEFNIRDIFRVTRRRKWIIILAPLLVGTLTYLFSRNPPPIYEAESLVKITRVAANMQSLLVEALYWYQGDNIATQSQVITSQRIKGRVALRLAQKYSDFQGFKAVLDSGEEVDYDAFYQRVRSDEKLVKLLDSMEIEAERKGDSDAVGILAHASSEKLAVDITNYTAAAFVDYNITERNGQIREAVQFIQARIQQTEQELSGSEQTLEEFKRDYRMVLALNLAEGGDIQEQIEGLGRQIANLDKGMLQLELIPSVDEYWPSLPCLATQKIRCCFDWKSKSCSGLRTSTS